MTQNTLHQVYQDVPYPNMAFPQSHLNRLASVATLLGLEPPPIERCRVLELGCAIGGNLIPMAHAFPESDFVGLDFASKQIAIGQNAINTLGLKNISLETKDILDIDSDLGQFDYIIAHGVYSWVPTPVRDKLLQVYQTHLAPNGIGYVSYNTYPGWYTLNIMRDFMLYHSRHDTDPHQRAEKARFAINFAAQAVPEHNEAHADLFKSYLEKMLPEEDAPLLHDEIAEVNDPLYFHQFVDHAAQHNLQYLAEATLSSVMLAQFPPPVQKQLQQIATSLIDLEQYIDYLVNRPHRCTLVCHQNVPLDRKLRITALLNFYITSRAKPVSKTFNLDDDSVAQFQNIKGETFSTNHPVSKAAMLFLHQIWPQAIHFKDLLASAWEMLAPASKNADPNVDASILAQGLLEAYIYSGDLLDFLISPPTLTAQISSHPLASPIARLQAADQLVITNLYHETIKLDQVAKFMLTQLDGTQTQADLLESLTTWAVDNDLKIKQGGQVIKDVNQLRQVLANLLNYNLQGLAQSALLVA